MLGKTEYERAKADMIVGWRNDHLYKNIGPLSYHRLGFGKVPDNEDELKKNLDEAMEIFVHSGHFLRGETWAVGSQNVTFADFLIWATLVLGEATGGYVPP